jgi:hypothetical protein
MTRSVKIVEEVPGVPVNERYFIRVAGKTFNFSTFNKAKDWCEKHNLEYKFEPFEP